MTENKIDNFGIRLRKLIDISSFSSQKEFAHSIGIHESSVTGYIKGDFEPSMKILIKMAEALNTTIDYLVTGREPEHPNIRVFKKILEDYDKNLILRDKKDLINYNVDLRELIENMEQTREKRPALWELFRELLRKDPDPEKVVDMVMQIDGIREEFLNWIVKKDKE